MFGRVSAGLVLILFVGFLGLLLHAKPAAALPPGFSQGDVANVPDPIALDFTPDGRMLVTS